MIRCFYFFIIGAILMSSCGEMREEITINPNGSGTYDISADVIPMMRGMMEGFAQMSIAEGEEADSATIAAKVDEMLWKDFGDEIDSVMSFDEKIPENIKSDPEKMALIENAEMYMRGGKSKGYLLSGLTLNFKNADDLQKLMELSKESTENDPKASMLFANSNTTMKISKNSFFRSSVREEDDTTDTPTLDELTSLFDDFSIITVINTPKKIKSVKVKAYEVVKQTNKSVTLKYDLEDIISNEPSEIMIKW